jgi:tRNA pseudouridine55 synthase
MAVLEVRCSAGTYVRSLARDLGERLGCGAYLGALTRTASGPFRLEEAHPLDRVREELAAGRLEPLLRPMDAGLSSIAELRIGANDREALGRGQVIRVREALPAGADEGPPDGDETGRLVRVTDEAGRLVAMGHVRSGRLYPDKVFITPEA